MKKETSGTNIALIGKDEQTVPIGALVKLSTKKDGIYGGAIVIARTRNDGHFDAIDRMAALKSRIIEKDEVNPHSVERLENIPVNWFEEFLNQLEYSMANHSNQ